jgi:hypothetical protein
MGRAPFLVIAFINFSISALLIGWAFLNPASTSVGAGIVALALIGGLLPLGPGVLSLYFSWPKAYPRDYVIRLFLSLSVTAAPWIVAYLSLR